MDHPISWRRELRRLQELDKTRASEVLAEFKARVEGQGKSVETSVASGDPAQELIKAANKEKADFIIISRRHQDSRTSNGIGHVASQAARYAKCSVILLDSNHVSPKTFLYATDGSPQAEVAGTRLRGLEIKGKPALLLCTVISVLSPVFVNSGRLGQPDYQRTLREFQSSQEDSARRLLLGLSEDFPDDEFRKRIVVRAGDPTEELLDIIEKSKVDFLVVGAKGVSTRVRFLLGSITLKIMERASCSMLIAR